MHDHYLEKHYLPVIDMLHVVRIRGFEPAKDETRDAVDLPGAANWFCYEVGQASQDENWNSETTGILWTDYEPGSPNGWDFDVLVTDDFLQPLRLQVEKLGYQVASITRVEDTMYFGDGSGGTVAILKHPDGWVIAR